MRLAFLLLLTPLFLSAAEPSAFGAGDLDAPNPYGLTEAEKHILNNKKTLDSIKEKTFSQSTYVESLQERLDGMQTVMEGLNETIHTNRLELQKLQASRDMGESERVVTEKRLEEQIKANETNILQLKTVLTEFSTMIDTINSRYVSKEEFNALVEEINNFKSSVAKSLSNGGVPTSGTNTMTFSGKSNAEVEAYANEQYLKKYYTNAIEAYTYLISKKYKPAKAHYMIGEMWYYRNEWEKALSYFKESAKRYDKASYMPTLMLHSAICMENLGDVANAKAFYNAIISNYPESQMLSSAQEHLDKLQ